MKSRKEKKRIADMKRKIWADKIMYTFLITVEKYEKAQKISTIESFKCCWEMFDDMVQEIFITKYPEEAHLIRAAKYLAKDILKEEIVG